MHIDPAGGPQGEATSRTYRLPGALSPGRQGAEWTVGALAAPLPPLRIRYDEGTGHAAPAQGAISPLLSEPMGDGIALRSWVKPKPLPATFSPRAEHKGPR